MGKEQGNGWLPDAKSDALSLPLFQGSLDFGEEKETPAITLVGRITRAPSPAGSLTHNAPLSRGDFEVEAITGEETVWERKRYQIIAVGELHTTLKDLRLRKKEGIEVDGWNEERTVEIPSIGTVALNLFRGKALRRRNNIPF